MKRKNRIVNGIPVCKNLTLPFEKHETNWKDSINFYCKQPEYINLCPCTCKRYVTSLDQYICDNEYCSEEKPYCVGEEPNRKCVAEKDIPESQSKNEVLKDQSSFDTTRTFAPVTRAPTTSTPSTTKSQEQLKQDNFAFIRIALLKSLSYPYYYIGLTLQKEKQININGFTFEKVDSDENTFVMYIKTDDNIKFYLCHDEIKTRIRLCCRKYSNDDSSKMYLQCKKNLLLNLNYSKLILKPRCDLLLNLKLYYLQTNFLFYIKENYY